MSALATLRNLLVVQPKVLAAMNRGREWYAKPWLVTSASASSPETARQDYDLKLMPIGGRRAPPLADY